MVLDSRHVSSNSVVIVAENTGKRCPGRPGFRGVAQDLDNAHVLLDKASVINDRISSTTYRMAVPTCGYAELVSSVSGDGKQKASQRQGQAHEP